MRPQPGIVTRCASASLILPNNMFSCGMDTMLDPLANPTRILARERVAGDYSRETSE